MSGFPNAGQGVAEHLANTQVESISWLIHGDINMKNQIAMETKSFPMPMPSPRRPPR